MTFFESENYGTVLQAYATQKYLASLGYTAELLHIKRMVNGTSSHYSAKTPKNSFFDKLRYKWVSLTKKKSIQKKSEKFRAFRKEYLHVSKYYDSGEILKKDLEDYDLYISGGDQIWNPYHKVFSMRYMFDFLSAEKPRIAYGSSFGVATIDDAVILSKMKDCLGKYQAIGVREQSGVEIIQKIGLNALQVVDPVFLLKEDWRIFVKDRPRKKKYCVVYALIDFPEGEKEQIVAFAKKRKLEVVILPFNRQNCLNRFHKAFGLSPQEFLNYIVHAEYVFTNSFHGLAFSILFQKQFTLLGCDSEDGKAKRERLIDLLKQLGIGDRNFESTDEAIAYGDVNELLQNRINESIKYIQESINKIGVN